MPVEIKGLEQLQARIQRMIDAAPAMAAEVVREQAADLLAASQAQVPVKTGELRASGYVEVVETTQGATATVGFSDPKALPVHERTWVRHRKGKAKFLTDPLQAAGPALRAALAAKFGGDQ
jgi:uncharacterized membrane protein